MQVWFVLIFFILGRYFSIRFFTDLSKIIIYLCFVQLLPFIRSDGYWLLSDLSGVSNLLEKSTLRLNEFSKAPFKKIKRKKCAKLFSHFLRSFQFIFCGFICLLSIDLQFEHSHSSPQIHLGNLTADFTGSLNHITFDAQYIPAILFYYISYSYLKLFFKKTFNSNKKSKQTILTIENN